MDGEDRKTSLCEASFFQGIPELEVFSIEKMPINGKLTSGLKNCRLLRELNIDWCVVDKFVPSFRESMKDKKMFPSLRALDINDSWSDKIDPYTEFTKYCASQRPAIAISGNERNYNSKWAHWY